MTADTQSDQGTKLLLTVEEAARALGLGRSLVYELVLREEIASIKVGRARRIPKLALEEFVANRLAMR
jgi:excisionase family DNA binding protein